MGTLKQIIRGMADAIGADMERDHVTLVLGVLVNKNERDTEVAVREFDQRIDAENFACPNVWLKFIGYGQKGDE